MTDASRIASILLNEVLARPAAETAYFLNPGDAGLLRSLDRLSAAQASAPAPGAGPSIAARRSSPLRSRAAEPYPAFKDRPIGGTLTLFIQVAGVRKAHDALRDRVKIVMPLEKKWYGVTEFAFEDPDGCLITFAERE